MANENNQDLTRFNEQELAKYSSDLLKKGLNLSKKISSKIDKDNLVNSISSNRWNNFFIQGIKHYALGDIKTAIDCFDKSLETDQNCFESLFLRGFSHTLLGNQEDSKKDLDLALIKTNNHDTIFTLYAKGHLSGISKKDDDMIKYHYNLLSINPDYKRPYVAEEIFIQGYIYYLFQDQIASLEKLNKALEINPNFVLALVLRGCIFWNIGNYQNSLQDLNSSLELNPRHINNAHTFYIRACVHKALGNYEVAISDFNESIRLYNNTSSKIILNFNFSNFVNVYLERGKLLNYLGNYYGAIEDFNYVIEIDPYCLSAYIQRATIYYEHGQKSQALIDCQRALDIDSNYAMAYILRGKIYNESGNYQSAVNDWTIGFLLQGNEYQQSGDYKAAIENYTAILEFDPNNYLAYNQRSSARSAVGDYQGAMEDLAKARQFST
ncbi:MAG: tetratricopeptide repeat protein [Snowella sp.]|nr:tetratricopeptide repeat protein [Snowella sp.]